MTEKRKHYMPFVTLWVNSGAKKKNLFVLICGGPISVIEERLPELKKFALMICRHQDLILNYFYAKKKFSSGIVEGFNKKAKLTIRRSYGFRSDKLREIALYHTLGNLPLPEVIHRFVLRGFLFH